METIFLHIIFERQVRDNHLSIPVSRQVAEILESILHDGIEISHQHQRNLYFFYGYLQLVERSLSVMPFFKARVAACWITWDRQPSGHWKGMLISTALIPFSRTLMVLAVPSKVGKPAQK